jgi:hypothetical protein
MTQKAVESLQKKNLKLFEMEFAGEHLGIIVPCFIVALLWYLVSYLLNIVAFLKRCRFTVRHSLPPFISPWVGAMSNRWAKFVSLVSMAVMPFLSVWLSLWRLSDQEFIVALMAGVMVAGFGMKCISLGIQIDRALEKREEADV